MHKNVRYQYIKCHGNFFSFNKGRDTLELREERRGRKERRYLILHEGQRN